MGKKGKTRRKRVNVEKKRENKDKNGKTWGKRGHEEKKGQTREMGKKKGGM